MVAKVKEAKVTSEGRDLNVKETPSTAKAKRGRPKEINRVVTKTSQSGLREGLTRATFIIREDTLDKLKERAYTDRKKLKDLVTEALDYYLEHNKSEETKSTRVGKNVAEFVEASSLAGVAGYAIYAGVNNNGVAYSVLTFAGAVVVLRAFQQLVKVFNKG